MSLSEQIAEKKTKLKNTNTRITLADGCTYIEDTEMRKLGLEPKKLEGIPRKHGFVVDLKPDNIPANVIPGLYIGSQDCTEPKVVEFYNITHILSIGVDIQTACKTRKFLPCYDLPEENILPILKESHIFIRDALNNDGIVLVHCNAGVSRASMVIIGYLILEKLYSFSDAYDLVKEKRPCIQPNIGFIKQLKSIIL